MDPSSAAEKVHERLSADLEADRTARRVAEPPAEAPSPLSEVADGDIERADGPAIIKTPAKMVVEEETPPSKPANDDRAQDNESRLYARGPAAEDRSSIQTIYIKADPAAVVAPDRSRFYDVGYRTELRRMVDHVVEVEAPIYFDVLVERIARAHGIQRSGENVQKVVAAALGRRRFPNSRDGDREIIWPLNSMVGPKAAYRGAGGRDHTDIPMPELAGLAEILRRGGLDEDEEIIRGMQEHFGLGRLAAPTRARFRGGSSNCHGLSAWRFHDAASGSFSAAVSTDI
jgi:hypothetical protein